MILRRIALSCRKNGDPGSGMVKIQVEAFDGANST